MSTTTVMGVSQRKPVRRRRAVAVAMAAFSLAIAAVTGLLGPLTSPPSAHAEDGNPTYYLGSQNGGDYVNFINDIRNRVNDGASTSVAGAGNAYQVDHTDARGGFIRVDIHMWGNPNYVRLQLRRSDLYVVGWWTGGSTYNYIGARSGAGPSDGASHGEWQTRFGEGYDSLESFAGQTRTGLAINRDSVNGAIWNLWFASNDRDMARGVLMMTQFLSEAARFRPLRDEIALTMNGNNTLVMPTEYTQQENSWSPLSVAFNTLLRQPQGTRDEEPREGWGRIEPFTGRPQRIILDTAVAYAQYVLATSLRR
ncbi:ribosome-inactivating family protein [Lentzea sp. NPDC004789]